MIPRESYSQKLIKLIDKPFIKVLTGIRRSGKSVILKQLQQYLQQIAFHENNVIYYNFESLENVEISNGVKLNSVVKARMKNDQKYYLIFDEIQEVESWEKAVNSLLSDGNTDIYITGSNSKLLSSELATYIAGRYVEIPISTLSFAEYLQFRSFLNDDPLKTDHEEFITFLRLGGFPAIHATAADTETAYKFVYDIYSSVILRDTIQRYNIRNIELLDRVIRFVFENIGNRFSAKNIADYFKSQQRKMDLNTVYNYLHALEGAFILSKVHRYDIKGKEVLQTNEKYYVSDISLVYAVLGYRDRMIAGILENIIYLELKRRGYQVYIGKLGDKEVDFIAERRGEKIYLQIAYKLNDAQTVEREFAPLKAISDNYPKYVVTMDDFWQDNINGIKHLHVADFLLSDIY
jgi:predicted AAA+ superfamily ATPase